MSKVRKVAAANIDSAIHEIVEKPYRRELVQNSDGTWFAKIAELPGVMTEGDTEAEALENLRDAMREWLRVQLEDRESIPEPWADMKYSGKFLVRVPPRLHRDIALVAAREGVSLNAFVLTALARAVGSGAQDNRIPVSTNQVWFGSFLSAPIQLAGPNIDASFSSSIMSLIESSTQVLPIAESITSG